MALKDGEQAKEGRRGMVVGVSRQKTGRQLVLKLAKNCDKRDVPSYMGDNKTKIKFEDRWKKQREMVKHWKFECLDSRRAIWLNVNKNFSINMTGAHTRKIGKQITKPEGRELGIGKNKER